MRLQFPDFDNTIFPLRIIHIKENQLRILDIDFPFFRQIIFQIRPRSNFEERESRNETSTHSYET